MKVELLESLSFSRKVLLAFDEKDEKILTRNRGEHRTHNPKVEGSNPSPATIFIL